MQTLREKFSGFPKSASSQKWGGCAFRAHFSSRAYVGSPPPLKIDPTGSSKFRASATLQVEKRDVVKKGVSVSGKGCVYQQTLSPSNIKCYCVGGGLSRREFLIPNSH